MSSPCFFFFNDTATTEIYTLSLHDALPICGEPSFALSPLDQLLDIGLHLYKEATSYLSITQGRDLHLMRFIDVMESIRATATDDVARLPEFVRTVGAERELFLALHHTSLLYPGAVPAELLRALEPPDRD